MWQQYRAPDDEPSAAPDPGLSAPQSIRAAGTGPGVGVVVGIVVVVSVFLIGAIVASSGGMPGESDYSDWYDCIAEEEADGKGGLLSPAELCDIGHERPPGYVDDYEYDPFGKSGVGRGLGDDRSSLRADGYGY